MKKIEGFKLVAGRSLRKWDDEQCAIEVISLNVDEDKLFTKKFVSVAQAEKLVGKAEFNKLYGELVIKPDGKPTLAPESDKRKALNNISDCFENIVDNNS